MEKEEVISILPEKIKLEGIFVTRIFFISVLAVIVLSSIYLAVYPNKLQLSPEATGVSYETAYSLLSSMSQDGIKWYCGEISSYTDEEGTVYGPVELKELKKILGNEEALRADFCQ